MRILTYKRTHTGDPDSKGRFGAHDCMGRVRSYDYNAVIGVGGIGKEPERFGIDRKINWVGIGPIRSPSGVVTFEYFALFDDAGPWLAELAPHLAKRMYGKNVRVLIHGYTARQQREAEYIVGWSRSRQARRLNGKGQRLLGSGCDRKCMSVAWTTSRC